METRRPNILTKDGKLSDNVGGFIIDRAGKTIGVILVDNALDNLIIQFMSKNSPTIIYNRVEDKAEVFFEEFPADPKRVLNKFVKATVFG